MSFHDSLVSVSVQLQLFFGVVPMSVCMRMHTSLESHKVYKEAAADQNVIQTKRSYIIDDIPA